MKFKLLYVIIFLLLCIFSCKKYEPNYMEGYTLNASGLRNGKPWKGSAKMRKMIGQEQMNLEIFNNNKLGLKEVLFFQDIDAIMSPQLIGNVNTPNIDWIKGVYYVSNGDEFLKLNYIMDDRDSNNILLIKNQDEHYTKNIKIQFSVTFILKGNKTELKDKEQYPDTLRFENVVVNIDAVE
jgi:hypothetical protein